MEKLFFNLSEEESTKGKNILLWIFAGAFFTGGLYVVMLSPVFGVHHIKPILSLAPFGISLLVGIIAAFSTIKRKDLFFLVDDDKIEFRYGVFKPKKHSFLWTEIKEFVMPRKQRKVKVLFLNGSSYVINLSWLQKKKSTMIRKHLFHAARSKNINVIKVLLLHREA